MNSNEAIATNAIAELDAFTIESVESTDGKEVVETGCLSCS